MVAAEADRSGTIVRLRLAASAQAATVTDTAIARLRADGLEASLADAAGGVADWYDFARARELSRIEAAALATGIATAFAAAHGLAAGLAVRLRGDLEVCFARALTESEVLAAARGKLVSCARAVRDEAAAYLPRELLASLEAAIRARFEG